MVEDRGRALLSEASSRGPKYFPNKIEKAPAAMPPISDLVKDSELDTSLYQDSVTHTYAEVTRGRQLISRQEHWTKKKELGRGGYGKVWLEVCSQGNNRGSLRAVKEVRKQVGSKHGFDYQRELEAVAKFSHRKYEAYFVKSFGWYQSAEAIYIAMEYFPHGDLDKYLRHTESRLSVDSSAQLTLQILEGLRYMHENGFAHRDVKPSNILIVSQPPEPWWIKLSDFGISKRAEDGRGPSTIKGTPGFMAPELQGYIENAQGTTLIEPQAADMWALGEIAFRMLTGERAFPNIRAFASYCTGQDGRPSKELMSLAGETATKFVDGLMAVQPHLRIKASDALSHPWMMSARRDEIIYPDASSCPESSSEQVERIRLRDESSSESLIEASARWSALSQTGYAESMVPSVAELPRSTSVSYLEQISQPTTATPRNLLDVSPQASIPPKKNYKGAPRSFSTINYIPNSGVRRSKSPI